MRDFSPNEIPRFPARLFSLFFVDKKRGKRIKTNQQTLEISGIFRFVFIIVYGHTYITNLIHASVDPKTVQYLAGHESSKITMDIYAKVKYNKPDELVRTMDSAFAQWDADGV